jgi:hypothetical protein
VKLKWMRPRASTGTLADLVAALISIGVLALTGTAVFLAYFRPLSLERVYEELGPDPDLVFVFATGVDNPRLPCTQVEDPNDDSTDQTATAIAVGWLIRRCEHDHIQFRLTPEGRRLSSSWSISGDSLTATRSPEDPLEWTTWFVTAARFERTGTPEIQSTEALGQKRVIVKGRWVTNSDGQALQRAGWQALRGPALREEVFELTNFRWHLIHKVLGIDLSGM